MSSSYDLPLPFLMATGHTAHYQWWVFSLTPYILYGVVSPASQRAWANGSEAGDMSSASLTRYSAGVQCMCLKLVSG